MGFAAFENKLESLISGLFARAFRSAVQPVEIAAALQREVDNNAQVISRDRRLVPNDFAVELSPGDLERLADYDSAMAKELTRQLHEHADAQSYVFPGPVAIGFEAAEDLSTGRFRIRSRAQARVTGGVTGGVTGHVTGDVTGDVTDSRTGSGDPGATQPPGVRRTRAVLEVNGTSHRLASPGLIVGRGAEADVRINDPGVSRRHVELLVPVPRDDATEPAITINDLGSTNGMLVNGQRVSTAPAVDGTWIKIGNTVLTVRVIDEPGQPSEPADV